LQLVLEVRLLLWAVPAVGRQLVQAVPYLWLVVRARQQLAVQCLL
jgi:hypothetical protein